MLYLVDLFNRCSSRHKIFCLSNQQRLSQVL